MLYTLTVIITNINVYIQTPSHLYKLEGVYGGGGGGEGAVIFSGVFGYEVA